MKILITGKTGTVGSNLKFGFGFSSKEFDLKKEKEAERLFSQTKPDAVVHCAAKVGGIQLHLKEKYRLFYDNILINTNVIESAKNHNVQRVLSFLSSCIFSDSSVPPYNESHVHEGEPFYVHYPYGFAKRMLEVQSRICYEEFGLIYNCVIPTNIYGCYDDFNFDTGHVVGVLIHKAYLAATNGTPFEIWGDGNQKRNFIYSEDVSKITEWALDNYKEKDPLILCNNVEVQISELAHLIAKEFNIENNIVFNTTAPSGQKQRNLNGNKLAGLNNFKFTSIEDGIKKTTRWFLENYPNIRK